MSSPSLTTSPNARIARSYLFVPANRPERFDKACEVGADAVIVDLEDAVPPDQKVAARASLCGWLSATKSVFVRINAAGTAWFDDDVALCAMPGVAGVVLPKAERIDDIRRLTDRRAAAVIPLIETARGIANANALAGEQGVQRLAFGSIDFQADLNIKGEWEELLYFRSQLVLASRLAGIQPPIDGVCTSLDDAQQIRAETLRARNLGFGAKLCIHPKQVAAVNAGFQPTQEEVAWARRVIDAMAASKGAAVAVDGKMVDQPVLIKAREIVNESSLR